MMNLSIRKFSVLFVMILCLFILGCSKFTSNVSESNEHIIIDSVGREVSIPKNITKAAVANRYNMEVIKSIGSLDKVVGVDYGIYQDQQVYGSYFTKNQVIGNGQNNLNYEKIIGLSPQVLIITGNGAWRDAEEKLAPFGIKVIVLDSYYTNQFAESYTLAGKIFNKEQEAHDFIQYFQKQMDYVQKQLKDVPRKTVYYEYKKQGVTTIPGDYFFEMLEYAHADNIFKNAVNVNIDIEAVPGKNPDYIIKVGDAGREPRYTPPTQEEFKSREEELINRPGWEIINAVRNNKILLLSQYVHGGASKIVGSLYVAKFLYPEYLPDLHPEQVFKEWVTKYQRLPYISGHTYPAFAPED